MTEGLGAWVRPVFKIEANSLIYLGGPVDYASHNLDRDWRHWPAWKELELTPYCPKCECAGLSDVGIIEQNKAALMVAHFAILDLRSHSIGTPIEMFWRLWQGNRPTILIAKEGSVFVRYTTQHYPAVVVADEAQALEAVKLLLGR